MLIITFSSPAWNRRNSTDLTTRPRSERDSLLLPCLLKPEKITGKFSTSPRTLRTNLGCATYRQVAPQWNQELCSVMCAASKLTTGCPHGTKRNIQMRKVGTIHISAVRRMSKGAHVQLNGFTTTTHHDRCKKRRSSTLVILGLARLSLALVVRLKGQTLVHRFTTVSLESQNTVGTCRYNQPMLQVK